MGHSTEDGTRLLELARREQGAIEVALLWDRGTGGAVLVVWNSNSGVCLQVDVEAEQAGYAFTHPYAFAAARGVPAGQVAQAASPPAGVYRAEIEINGSDVYIGWAVLPNGTQLGVIDTGQGTSPAPHLTFDDSTDPPTATFTLNGQDYQAHAVQAGEEIPSPEASPAR